MSFSNLPTELLFMICEKLESVNELVQLSSCSKRLNFICREVKYDKLSEIKSRDKHVHESIIKFNKHIKIRLNLKCQTILDVSMLGNVHTLILSNCYNFIDVSNLGRLNTLDLTYCNVTDVSKLGNVHNLNL